MRLGRALLMAAAVMRLSAGSDASPGACAACHRAQTEAFAQSAMTRALESGAKAEILRANPKLAVKLGAYSYEIARDGERSIYTVSDGKEAIRVPVEWAFGQGAAGQTYVFRREGKWYESRVSYFSVLRGLDLTMGGDPAPSNLAEAAGRVAPVSEMRQCFDCHATNVGRSSPLVPAGMVAGVQCERCHGATAAHLSAGVPMKKLGAMTTEEQSDFCGQCHRTWSQIAANGPHDIGNVRFQPYRLANSRCYDAADRRIRCTACHDPHRQVVTVAAVYDAKCSACHSAASARKCKTASANCVTCHMPRLELPGAHQRFTDHRIRIVRADQAYPDEVP
jgi:hypothetical protein